MRLNRLQPGAGRIVCGALAGILCLPIGVCTSWGAAGDGVLVGAATSMEKVLPRGANTQVVPVREISLALARNEKESVQILVQPQSQALKQVQLRLSDLQTADGEQLAASQISAAPVGYVETKSTPPYGSSHVGWWPDPILDFLTTADIAAGDVQAFWVRVRAPRDQQPGVYHGTLEVLAEQAVIATLSLSVEVYPFAVPVASPLPLAVTFKPHDLPLPETEQQQAAWRESSEYPVKVWREKRIEWGDFLADYYLTYDSLYFSQGWTPDFEILQRLHERGQLGRFNLGYYGILGEDTTAREAWNQDTLTRIQAAYAQAKQLGLLDHAYIYGCDEHPADQFPAVERAAARLKEACPGALIMTTSYDHSFSTDSVIKSVDAFCPLTPRFDKDLAAKARSVGKQVWWYICCGPHHPHANMFIEYPAIDGRVLMGAQTAKYRPDGFLYYQISIWNSQHPITSGPFTDWDPRSWTTYHGDGSWTCVGPGGSPLATIRLENFRDGLEDYAYVKVLESLIETMAATSARTAAQEAWLQEARAALQVPEELCKSMTEYSSDPQVVYRWRAHLADVIRRAGIAPDTPL